MGPSLGPPREDVGGGGTRRSTDDIDRGAGRRDSGDVRGALEVGKLRRVMIHRPDLELKRLTPANHDELLFDDVLWVKRASEQHDAFADLLRSRGVEVLYLEELLTQTLALPDARRWVLERTVTPFTLGAGMADEVRAYLDDVEPAVLADHLIGGLTKRERPSRSSVDARAVTSHAGSSGVGRWSSRP